MTATIDPRIRERRVEVQRAAGRRRLRITLLVVFALVALGCVYLLVHSPLLDVDHVRVEGVQQLGAQEVIDTAAVDRGAPLLRVDTGAVRDRLEQLPWVARADVDAQLPGTLRITVHERVPAAYARRDETTVVLFDASGFAISDVPAPPAGLVEVRGAPQIPPVGGTLAPLGTAGVVQALPAELASRVAAIQVSGDGRVGSETVALVLHGGGEVRLCAPVDLEAKGASALAVLQRMGAMPFAYLDVCVPQSPVAGGVPGA
jgi:cell division septal protein FtsQ